MRLAQGSAQQSGGVQFVTRGHCLYPLRWERSSIPSSPALSTHGIGIGIGFRLGTCTNHVQRIGLIQSAAGKYIHVGQKPRTRPALAHQHLYFGTCMPVNKQAGRVAWAHGRWW